MRTSTCIKWILDTQMPIEDRVGFSRGCLVKLLELREKFSSEEEFINYICAIPEAMEKVRTKAARYDEIMGAVEYVTEGWDKI